VLRPPVDYDHRRTLQTASQRLVRERYPQLQDLSEAGTLVAIPRSALYAERRTDGYREPELVLLVGTSHASAASADEVRRTIEAVRPDNVVVELCRSRSSVMYAPPSGSGTARDALALSGKYGEDFFATFRKTMELGGQSALLLRLLLGQISKRLAKRMGVDGKLAGEFIAARVAAERVGSQLVLGDRPIEVTLRRAWDRLSLSQKVLFVKMLWSAYTSEQSEQSQELLEALRKDDDAVNGMLVALTEEFPELAESFVYERDLYLAWSLKRSKAVNQSKTVVGVVGKGHMRGVCYALTHDAGGGLRFRDLAGSQRQGRDDSKNAAARFAIESGIFIALWAAWASLT
jgi:pheromone shutdown protein TraB